MSQEGLARQGLEGKVSRGGLGRKGEPERVSKEGSAGNGESRRVSQANRLKRGLDSMVRGVLQSPNSGLIKSPEPF